MNSIPQRKTLECYHAIAKIWKPGDEAIQSKHGLDLSWRFGMI